MISSAERKCKNKLIFTSKYTKRQRKREQLIEQLRTKLFSSLTEGSLKDTMDIYTAFVSGNSLISFMKES